MFATTPDRVQRDDVVVMLGTLPRGTYLCGRIVGEPPQLTSKSSRA
jgi:hypothetical protein